VQNMCCSIPAEKAHECRKVLICQQASNSLVD